MVLRLILGNPLFRQIKPIPLYKQYLALSKQGANCTLRRILSVYMLRVCVWQEPCKARKQLNRRHFLSKQLIMGQSSYMEIISALCNHMILPEQLNTVLCSGN